MSGFDQSDRIGRLITTFGQTELALSRLSGSENVNALFTYRVEALSTSDSVDFNALIGTHATAMIETESGPQYWDGIVTEAHWGGPIENGWRYDLTLRPWIWLAGHRRNQRIFHNQTVVEILETLLSAYSELGNPHLQVDLSRSYPLLEYTVQYRESDLDFARRLMERFAISFYFTHDEGSHTLVLTDSITSLDSIGTRPYHAAGQNREVETEHFWKWGPLTRITTGAIRLTDFEFNTPMAELEVERHADVQHAQGQIESFDYPGDYTNAADGRTMATWRLEQERASAQRHLAEGDCIPLRAGGLVTLDNGEEVPGNGEEHLCLGVNLAFDAQSFGSGGGTSERPFVAHFELTPASIPVAPPRVTPVPVVQGPQTAMVVGSDEIDCDEFGRILVRFHWDLDGAHSMRCRVSQNWAGKGWGGMVIPRIGMEVVVEFLEGDPDKPLVTGCVYNGANDPPYPLPAHKTRSTFKTDSYQGSGFNELRFEDKSGAEEIFVHAQKNRNEKTLNSHSERIDNNWVQSVGHNKSIEVTNNHDEAVGGNMSLTVGPGGLGRIVSAAHAVHSAGIGNVAKALGVPGIIPAGEGHLSVTIDKTRSEAIGISSSTTIGVSSELTVGKSIKVTSGESIEVTSDKSIDVTSGETARIQVGDSLSQGIGKTMTLDIGDQLTIRVGSSQLEMKKDGTIALSGKDIVFKASGKIKGAASSSVILKGSKIQLN